MLSVPNILPSVKFPNVGNVSYFSCFSYFSWGERRKMWEKKCSIRTALSFYYLFCRFLSECKTAAILYFATQSSPGDFLLSHARACVRSVGMCTGGWLTYTLCCTAALLYYCTSWFSRLLGGWYCCTPVVLLYIHGFVVWWVDGL